MWNYADGKMVKIVNLLDAEVNTVSKNVAHLQVHVENIRGPGDDDMEKAVRSVTVFHVGEALFITAVLLNKYSHISLSDFNLNAFLTNKILFFLEATVFYCIKSMEQKISNLKVKHFLSWLSHWPLRLLVMVTYLCLRMIRLIRFSVLQQTVI